MISSYVRVSGRLSRVAQLAVEVLSVQATEALLQRSCGCYILLLRGMWDPENNSRQKPVLGIDGYEVQFKKQPLLVVTRCGLPSVVQTTLSAKRFQLRPYQIILQPIPLVSDYNIGK